MKAFFAKFFGLKKPEEESQVTKWHNLRRQGFSANQIEELWMNENNELP